MNRLDRLIRSFVPGSVERTTIGEIAEVRSGWGFPNDEQGASGGSHPFYKVSDMNLPGNEQLMRRARNYVDDSAVARLGVKLAPAGTVVFPKIGAAVATNKKRMLTEPSAYDNNVMGLIPGDRVLPRFLLYFMQNLDLATLSRDSGAVPSIRKSDVEAAPIAIPPLPMQQSIIEALDNFAELEAQIEAEIEARRRQFAHYQKLLTEPSFVDNGATSGWIRSTLGELCRVEKGRTAIQKATPGPFPLVVTGRDRLSSADWDFEAEAVCIPLVSAKGHGVASISRLIYQSGKFALGTILCAAIPKRSAVLSAEFLFHYLDARRDRLLVPLMRGGANVSLTVQSLRSVPIEIPPLDVQVRVVDSLRTLGALLEDETCSLPAELAARRKQYEYYRDKLLTFEEAPA